MREITKTISIRVDGKPMDFRLAKPDIFSGAVLQKVPDRIFDRTATNLVYTLPATTIMEQ